MEVITFDVCGKFAHFRKFYSNSSALTHFVPPRTTIIGIIAGILGIERDTYYEEFSLENCDIGVRLLTRVKKSIQKLKYLKVEHTNHLNGSYFDPIRKQHIANTMVPFEFVTPFDLKEKDCFVSYRFYYRSKTDKNRANFENLKKQLANLQECYYPVSLGTANFSAFINGYAFYNDAEIIKSDKNVTIDSIIPIVFLKEFPSNSSYHLIQETLPMDFDKDRYLKKHSEVLFDLNCKPLDVQLNNNYILLTKEDHVEHIVFMN